MAQEYVEKEKRRKQTEMIFASYNRIHYQRYSAEKSCQKSVRSILPEVVSPFLLVGGTKEDVDTGNSGLT